MYQMTFGSAGSPVITGPAVLTTQGDVPWWASAVDVLIKAGGTALQYKTTADTLRTQRALAASQAERDAIDLEIARLQAKMDTTGSIPSWVWMAAAGAGALILVVVLTRR